MSDQIITDWTQDEPPTTKGSGDVCEQQGPYTSGAASSAAIQIAHAPSGYGECFVTFIVSGNAVRMNFGNSAVAAADTNAVLFPIGKYRLRITSKTQYFRHIQVTGAGSIDVYRSSR